MDEQLFTFMKDRFDGIDSKLDEHRATVNEHIETDRQYWKVLDEQQAQLSLIKRVLQAGATVVGFVLTYLGLRH